MEMIVTLFAIFFVFIISFAVWQIKTKQLLRKHTNEWQAIKAKAIENGECVDLKYLEYVRELKSTAGFFGACFPPK